MRLPFAIRLTAVVLLTIMVVGIGHERYAANAFLEGLVYERLDVHRGDARWIENEVSQGHVGSPTARVQELLVLLGARPNLHSIELINSITASWPPAIVAA